MHSAPSLSHRLPARNASVSPCCLPQAPFLLLLFHPFILTLLRSFAFPRDDRLRQLNAGRSTKLPNSYSMRKIRTTAILTAAVNHNHKHYHLTFLPLVYACFALSSPSYLNLQQTLHLDRSCTISTSLGTTSSYFPILYSGINRFSRKFVGVEGLMVAVNTRNGRLCPLIGLFLCGLMNPF